MGALRGSNCLNDLVDTVCLSCPLRRYVGFAEVEASSPRTEMITREREANRMTSVVKGDGWVGRCKGKEQMKAALGIWKPRSRTYTIHKMADR